MRLSTRAGAASLLIAANVAMAAPDWQTIAPPPDHRSESSLVEHEGKVYLFNGFTFGIRLQKSIDRFDPASGDWRSLRPTATTGTPPTAVSHNGLVLVGKEAWFIGGRVGDHPGRVTNTVAIYDLERDTWRAGPALPVPFAGGGAALVGRRIHVFGGFDAEARCDVATHLVHDLERPGEGWQDITGEAAMPLPRGHFGTTVLGGKIYAIGGQNGHDRCPRLRGSGRNVRHVHAYDPSSGRWQRLADLPHAESHIEPSTFVHDGMIWVVGGQSQGDKVLNYHPGTNRWTVRHDLTLPTSLIAPGALVIDGVLHVFGGGAPNVARPLRKSWTLRVGGVPGEGDDGDTGGEGTGGGTDAALEILPLDIDFGAVESGSTARRELVLRNTGTTSVEIAQVLLRGTAADSYRLVSTVPPRLAGGDTLRVGIEFVPTGKAGERVAIASVLHDPASTLTLVSLAGRVADGPDTDTGDDTGTGTGTGNDTGNDGGRLTAHRINAGGADVVGPDGTLWRGDRDGSLGGVLRSPSRTWRSGLGISLDAASAELDAPATLFSTERFGHGGDLRWDFPVRPGAYRVHLFFAELYGPVRRPGGRVFGVELEGETRLEALDVFVASGDAGRRARTLVRSFTVDSDETLSLRLVRNVQNPAIKAIAILPCDASCDTTGPDNRAPTVDAGTDRRLVLGDVLALEGRAGDDGLPGGTLTSTWAQRSGPAGATFGDTALPSTTVTFPALGSYVLRLSANDGSLSAQDEIRVTVVDAQQDAAADFVELDGRVSIEAERYSAIRSSATHAWQLRNDSGASGAQSMEAGPDRGTLRPGSANSPMLAFEVAFEAPGRRYVWIRGLGDTNSRGEGKDDSLHVGLNGRIMPGADKIDHFPASWSWSRSTRDGAVAHIDIPSAGTHTVNLWMREDGLRVDAIRLLRDVNGTP